MDDYTPITTTAADDENRVELTADEAKKYLYEATATGHWFGIGVFLILLGVALTVLLSVFGKAVPGVLALFVCLAVAVALFIIKGLDIARYERYKRRGVRIPDDYRNDLEADYGDFHKGFGLRIAIGVGIILLSIGIVVAVGAKYAPDANTAKAESTGVVQEFSEDVSNGVSQAAQDVREAVTEFRADVTNAVANASEAIEDRDAKAFLESADGLGVDLGESRQATIAVSVLLAVIGIACYLFISGALRKSAYELLLGIGDFRHPRRTEALDRRLGAVAAVYWPLVTAGYLAWSFISDRWDRSWLIWPIAALAYAAFSGGYSALYKDHRA
ncbi:MAG: hypothetical protein LBR73_02695 [Oscillospiraceae bacterium]|jgi:hypothetical protein|nr:hypothetical protein [Oscillospiraceae bacterium]